MMDPGYVSGGIALARPSVYYAGGKENIGELKPRQNGDPALCILISAVRDQILANWPGRSGRRICKSVISDCVLGIYSQE